MGILWGLGQDPRHRKQQVVVHFEGLANRSVRPKIFPRHALRQQHRVRPLHRSLHITLLQRKAKKLQEITIREKYPRLFKLPRPYGKQDGTLMRYTQHTADLGHRGLQPGRHARRVNRCLETAGVNGDPVDPVRMSMEPVITQFVPDPQQDQEARRHPDCESQDING